LLLIMLLRRIIRRRWWILAILLGGGRHGCGAWGHDCFIRRIAWQRWISERPLPLTISLRVIREWRVVSDRPMRWRQWVSAGACKEQVASGRNDRNQTKRSILARKFRNYRGPWETDILRVEMSGVVWCKRLL
jgi:hypothetical protein